MPYLPEERTGSSRIKDALSMLIEVVLYLVLKKRPKLYFMLVLGISAAD